MKIVIIIPTYNEKENIQKMINYLEKDIFPKVKKHKLALLVVDDSSPDGTAKVVKGAMKKYKNIHLLGGKKEGLGVAYVRGMKYAMKKLSADWVVEMDADFQHNPDDLLPMIKAIDKGYDYIIGSRYVTGGSIPKQWALYRKFLSVFGSLFARIVLWIPGINDITSGFKLTKVKGFLDSINLDEVTAYDYSKRYAYKVRILYEIVKRGAKVKEVPIKFQPREEGISKMPKNNFKDTLRLVLTLRWRDSQRLIKVIIVGGIGAIIQFSIFNLLRLSLKPEFANTIAVEIAIISNFVINNMWTFKDRKIKAEQGIGKLIAKFGQFNLVSLGSILIQFIVVRTGVTFFGRSFIIENLLVAVGILIGLIWNYFMYVNFVWKLKK